MSAGWCSRRPSPSSSTPSSASVETAISTLGRQSSSTVVAMMDALVPLTLPRDEASTEESASDSRDELRGQPRWDERDLPLLCGLFGLVLAATAGDASTAREGEGGVLRASVSGNRMACWETGFSHLLSSSICRCLIILASPSSSSSSSPQALSSRLARDGEWQRLRPRPRCPGLRLRARVFMRSLLLLLHLPRGATDFDRRGVAQTSSATPAGSSSRSTRGNVHFSPSWAESMASAVSASLTAEGLSGVTTAGIASSTGASSADEPEPASSAAPASRLTIRRVGDDTSSKVFVLRLIASPS
mmetsp:Transcript_47292/g.143219  ORF Transcript_47292/g.143219 Transcript_47292/m.143219 type:complete len:302 (-) Transcript_47292:33-938(-)